MTRRLDLDSDGSQFLSGTCRGDTTPHIQLRNMKHPLGRLSHLLPLIHHKWSPNNEALRQQKGGRTFCLHIHHKHFGHAGCRDTWCDQHGVRTLRVPYRLIDQTMCKRHARNTENNTRPRYLNLTSSDGTFPSPYSIHATSGKL